MAFTKVGPKYQVTIPKVAREAIGLRVGDLIEAAVSKDGVLLRPKIVIDKKIKPPASLAALQRRAKRQGIDKLTLREIEREITATRGEKAKRRV